MDEVRVELSDRSYPVRFGALASLVPGVAALARRPALVVVDEHVLSLHGDTLRGALGSGATFRAVGRGESAKTLDSHRELLEAALEAGVERGGLIVAVGGGVVTDLAGFVAATYHRGIDWVAVPTTVLAMVDASVGGKTGVNLGGAKNLVGAFHQPRAVLADVRFLETLEPREVRAGLVEALKIGVVRDAGLVDLVERETASLVAGDPEALGRVILRSVARKAEVVAVDEREGGERALLNFGHTVGHALEAATGFARWLHGEAVAVGIAAALRLSVRELGLAGEEARRVTELLAGLGAPTEDTATPWSRVAEAMARDKKCVDGRPAFVLTPRIGSGSFGHRLAQDIVNEEVAALFGGRG